MSGNVINLRSRSAHPSARPIRQPVVDWSAMEKAERDGFTLYFSPLEWSLLVSTLEQSQYAAVQQLGDDVRRQMKEQTA